MRYATPSPGRSSLVAGIVFALSALPTSAAEDPAFADHVAVAKDAMFADPAAALTAARGAEAAGGSDTDALTAAWLEAEALSRLDRPAEALARIEAAQGRSAAAPPKLLGDLTLAKARALKKLEDEAEALVAYQDAYAAFAEAADARGQSMALMGIANLYKRARRWRRALDYFEQAQDAYEGDDGFALVLNNNRASVLRELGRLAEAEEQLRANLVIAERMGTGYPAANTHLKLADLALDRQDADAAAAHVDAAAALSETPGAATWHRYALLTGARLAIARGDDARAGRLLSESFAGWDGESPAAAADERLHALAAAFYERSGDLARALAHAKALAEIDADLNGAAAANSFNLLNAEFEASNRELEIERLNNARLEAELQARLTRERTRDLVTAVAALAGAGALLLVLWHLRSAWAASAKLEAANADLSEANEAKTRFLANTSHEIRTPLNAILGMAEALLSPDAEPLRADRRERIETIERSGKLLLAIVTDILDVAKMEDGKLKPKLALASIAGLASDVRGTHLANAEAKGLAVELDAPEGLPRYVTDARLVMQALGNLVSNAIKFTDEGRVRIEAREAEDGFTLSVSDTGIGIPTGQLDHVFEAFTQIEDGADRRYGGTGLGLAIVRDIAGLLGGTVSADSEPGEGTTFTLRVPASLAADAPASDAPAHDAPQPEADLAGLRVLLAEDNPVNVAVVRALLGGVVASLDVAEDGHSAVERVRLQPYDVVLMDNQMPGMSGGEATEAIRAMPGRADTPIIGVTADVAPAVRRGLVASGMDVIVAKPVSRAGLIEAIRAVTGGREVGVERVDGAVA